MERWPADRWESYRQERLSALLRHAAATVPYWGELLRGLGAEPEDFRSAASLRALPPLTKEVINSRGAELRSCAEPRGREGMVTTGGSTGQRVWQRTDLETQDRRRAAGRLTEEWDGIGPGTRTAILWGAALDAKPSRTARLYDRLTGQLFLSAYGVGDAEVARYFERLARFRPEVISAYPSLLLDAARGAGRERCRWLGVRVIYTSAEALFEPVREELADLFGAVVRNRYASREFGLIASD